MDILVNSSFFVLFVSLFIGSLSYAANNMYAAPLEKKLMTNFEKIKIQSSVAYIFSILVLVITLITQILKGEISGLSALENHLIAYGVSLLIIFISMFIGIITTNSIYEKFREKKYIFLITLEDDSEWEIIKMTGTNYLVLKNTLKDRYRLIKEYDNLSIKIVKKT